MPAESPDALSALAPLLRVKPELQSLCRFEGAWVSAHDRESDGWAPFHMVTAGRCILDVGGDLHHLHAGDVAILPHGGPHSVRAATDPTRAGGCSAPIRSVRGGTIEVKTNSDSPDVELICGRLTFEQPDDNFVRAALPRIMVLSGTEGRSVERVRVLLTAIRDELDAGEPGALSVSSDLARGLLVVVLRIHVQNNAVGQGHLRLLAHKQTARLLTAIMVEPTRVWSLDMMAASAGLSRATLVREFRRLADSTPFDVLNEVRLNLARQSLLGGRRPLAEIALEAGYSSQASFSRAFKRHFDQTPGALRPNP